jgi:RNA polymerase sigma-70 factor (ECF subfamily)
VAELSGGAPSQEHSPGFPVPRFPSSNDLIYNELAPDAPRCALQPHLSQEGAGMPQRTQDDLQTKGTSALYTDFAAAILGYLCTLVANIQDAEDLLLEVFMAAFNSDLLLQLPAQRQLAWLRRVARNKAADRYRHVTRLTLVSLEHASEAADEDVTPQQLAERRQAYQRLTQLIGQLPPIQQELLRLRYWQDLRLTQIAEQWAKPEGSVRKLLSRTLRTLRTHYEQSERGDTL